MDPCAPPVVLGNHLITIDGGRPVSGYDADEDKGKVVFTELGVPPRIIYEMHTDRIRATPVVVGDTLFLRTYQDLLAIRYTGEAGKSFERLAKIQYLFDTIGPEPTDPPPVHLTLPDQTTLPDAPQSILRDRAIPQNWLKLGPFPLKTDVS